MDNRTGGEADKTRWRINESYVPLLTDPNRYKVIFGSAGSGKSVFIAQKIVLRVTTEKPHRFLVVRKLRSTMKESVFQLIIDVLIEHGIYAEFEINKSDLKFHHIPTGNEILLTGIDDPEKIKSIQGITSVWVEESTELDEADFNQLELRVRGEKQNPVEFLLTFNPVDENHWLKKRFFDNQDAQTTILKTTYKDNAFLDDAYIHHLTERVKSNENLYRIYVLGEWGREQTGQEFYHQFKASQHVLDQCVYDPNLPIWLSWDENVNPYLPALVCQIRGKQLNVIDEIIGIHPNNTIERACLMFKNKYFAHRSGVIITGDATSQKQDVKLEKGFDFFRLILNNLYEFNPVKRVPSSNPSVYMRGLFINAVFGNNHSGIQININPNCTNLINDLMYTKQAADGTKNKEMETNDLGVRFQKYGHTSDCLDYVLNIAFSNEYASFQRGESKPSYLVGQKTYNKNLRF